jgi:diguanylate cyclase (GGDEF)-like protein
MHGEYQTWTVILSILVAVSISYAALSLCARVAGSRGAPARLWLTGGALTLGVGIWATHFIGMLAYHLPITLAYNLPLTLLSLAVAIAASAYALAIVSARSITSLRLLQSAVITGAGISAMHYIGMSAITIVPPIRYDLARVAASIGLAVAAAYSGLYLNFRLRQAPARYRHVTRAGGALAMGLAISLMHYTGMSATRIPANAYCLGGAVLDQRWIALLVAVVSLGLTAILGVLLLVDAHVASRLRQHALALEHANQRLQRAATHDALTGLPNRNLLMERLAQVIQHSRRSGTLAAVLVIDVDRFKAVNDSLGHLAGDALLRVIATRIRGVVRNEDTLARFGGDEFVLLVDGLRELADVTLLAQRMRTAVAEPLLLGGVELQTSLSIGISVCPADGSDCTTLLQKADSAMYHSKKAGRDSAHFYTPEMDSFTRERLELESGLRHALARGEFIAYYQPRVDALTGRIQGAEALIRWNHPTRGLISPAAFIPIAEESGMIVPIGEWMLQQACQQLRAWHDLGHSELRVAVNLSALQFNQPTLFQVVVEAIRSAGIRPSSLELELTESAVMRDAAKSVRVLSELAMLGVSIAVDDFGTGYSSLSYLRRLPLHRLKIDRSFIAEVCRNPEDAEIVRAIVSLAHSLNLQVTAEGVESVAQLEVIREMGCDEYQGYLTSTPLPPEQFLARLSPAGATSRRLKALGNSAIAALRSTSMSVAAAANS